MSVLYETLLRAQQKSSQSGKAPAVVIAGQQESAGRTGMESAYSPVANSSQVEPRESSFVPRSAREDIPERSLELPRQIVIENTLEPPEGITALHGFRRLILPYQRETRLVFRSDPHGLAAEQFRLLRRTLCQEFETGTVLMITSPAVGDGKTLTALNLSACLAESGDPTLLVELDLRWPAIGTVLGCELEAPGVEDAFAGRVEPGEAVNFIGELSFHVAVVSKSPGDRSRPIDGAGVKRFLTWAREHFRWVVLDTAPVLGTANVADLLPIAGAVLLVIRAQKTPRELSRQAFEMLGGRLHGVIFNEAPIDSEKLRMST